MFGKCGNMAHIENVGPVHRCPLVHHRAPERRRAGSPIIICAPIYHLIYFTFLSVFTPSVPPLPPPCLFSSYLLFSVSQQHFIKPMPVYDIFPFNNSFYLPLRKKEREIMESKCVAIRISRKRMSEGKCETSLFTL